tara:strand:- start:410 stop:661 length:252 start_codon:yes stop_codon:yes gene_type:complete
LLHGSTETSHLGGVKMKQITNNEYLGKKYGAYMDIAVSIIIVTLLAVYQPGNKELNDLCKEEVAKGEFETRIQCWNWHRPKER